MRIQFRTSNAAFQGRRKSESARILREIAEKLEEGHDEGIIQDVNGNKVGSWNLRPL